MKKLLLGLMIAISFTACKNDDKTSDRKVLDSTSVQWIDSTFRDFGKVKQGDVLEVAFHFKNTGDHNLVIADVSPGCGCTDPEKPAEPIAPGKEGVIKAKFKSAGQHLGEHRKYITVSSNIKSAGRTDLIFRAEVVANEN